MNLHAGLGFSPQQLGPALKVVQQFNLAVHVLDLIFQVLAGDVHLLAELCKYARQLPADHKRRHG